MKKIIVLIFLLLCKCHIVNADTIDVFNHTAWDYLIEVSIIEMPICECNITQYHEGENKLARFYDVKINKVLRWYTSDSIQEEKLKTIKYLLVPQGVILDTGQTLKMIARRGFNYNYLEYVKEIPDTTILMKRGMLQGTIGLWKCPKNTKITNWLLMRRIISYNTYVKISAKCEEQKHIEQCLEECKKE